MMKVMGKLIAVQSPTSHTFVSGVSDETCAVLSAFSTTIQLNNSC